jgi:thioredoxin reductase (NADPH)
MSAENSKENTMTNAEQFDVVILGTGPAGLQAAIHAARKNARVLVLGKETKSSLFHAHIENFCCMFDVTGDQILRLGRQQAAGFGAAFKEQDVLHIHAQGARFAIDLEDGDKIAAKALILATGTQRNRLGITGEKEYIGKGVSYCVDCDGLFFKGQDVVVVGNESAAVDGALTLAEYANRVYLASEHLDISDTLKARLAQSKVAVHEDAALKSITGDDTQVTQIQFKDDRTLAVQGVFIEQGAKGVLQLATSLGIMLDDEMRYIQTDKQQATNVPGIYAAGDVCGPPWQMAKAVGEGCVAGINAAVFARKAS